MFQSIYKLMSSFSASLPLHDGLIISTSGPDILIVIREDTASNMFRMSTVAAWISTFTSWVSEEGNETIVITTGEELSVVRSSDTVDVSTIGSLGVDTLSAPLEFHSLSSPNNRFGISSARWILRTIFRHPEEEFISTTV